MYARNNTYYVSRLNLSFTDLCALCALLCNCHTRTHHRIISKINVWMNSYRIYYHIIVHWLWHDALQHSDYYYYSDFCVCFFSLCCVPSLMTMCENAKVYEHVVIEKLLSFFMDVAFHFMSHAILFNHFNCMRVAFFYLYRHRRCRRCRCRCRSGSSFKPKTIAVCWHWL